jgi:hypothetical protein
MRAESSNIECASRIVLCDIYVVGFDDGWDIMVHHHAILFF